MYVKWRLINALAVGALGVHCQTAKIVFQVAGLNAVDWNVSALSLLSEKIEVSIDGLGFPARVGKNRCVKMG